MALTGPIVGQIKLLQMESENNGPPLGAIQGPTLLAPGVISSSVLGLVAWWIGCHTNLTTVKDLVVRNFKGDDIFSAWCKLREATQQAAGQPLQVPPRHRSEAKLAEELVKDVSENEKSNSIHLLVPACELGIVRGKLECNTEDERPVASRLESLEDMVKGVMDKLARIETAQKRSVNEQQLSVPQAVPQVHLGVPGAQQHQSYAAAAATGRSFAPQVQQILGNRQRRTSLSVKRSVSGMPRDQGGNVVEGSEDVFTDVTNKKKKKKEVFTGKAVVQEIAGVNIPLQAAYQHFVGNTPGNMDEDTLKLVFKELAAPVLEDKGIQGPLEIEECNLLTREGNSRTRVWRVVVPHRFRDIMKDDRIYPSGWQHREFEGHYRPPLTPEQRAEREAKKLARQQNDSRVEALLRQLAGPLQ